MKINFFQFSQSLVLKRFFSLLVGSFVSMAAFAQEQASKDTLVNQTMKEVLKESKKGIGPSREAISFTVIGLLVVAIIASFVYTMKKQAKARKIDAAARKAAAAIRKGRKA